MDVKQRHTVKIWFHRSRAIAWVLLTLAALRWWPDSVAFVIIASCYANIVGDLGTAEAADDRDILERLDRIEALLADLAEATRDD